MTAGGLAGYIALRDRGASQPIGDGGLDTCAALSDALDAALRELAGTLEGEPLAVVAVGGYGRREQCLYSDVDVMLLHADADLGRATAAVLYPLWDANLKVGHSVRTVDEAVTAAKANFETLTSLLTMRCLAGDASLVAALEEYLCGLLHGRPLAPTLAAAERERRIADPYPVMAADVKNGRGGLRTYHGLLWERRRHELLWSDKAPERAGAGERAAYADLLAVRNALHAAAGRPVDRFHFDLRPPAAEWLGVEVHHLATLTCGALRLGDRLAERRWPDLFAGQADPFVAAGRSVFSRVTSRFRRTTLPAGRATTPLALAVQAAARPEGVRLDSVEIDRLRASSTDPWTDEDRHALVQLLAAGARGQAAWGILDDVGWVDAQFPEWAVVRALPQLAPFHDHPVDAHLWRTVGEMNRLGAAGSADVREVFEEVGSTEELMLAAFFHDIGKGHGGDHSARGAEIASAALRRWGFGPATAATVTRAVRHHLLLSEAATRRDVDDPATAVAVVDAAGDLHTLKVLYLLSIADARATGASMWTEWKATLLRTLYRRASSLLDDTPPAEAATVAAVTTAGGYEPGAVEEHLAAMPPGYLAGADPGEVAWHMATVAALDGEPVAMSVRAGEHIDRVAVATADRPGLLGTIATVMAVHGVSILGARAHGRADGIALDVLDVADDRIGGSVPAERWERVGRDLPAAVLGELDLSQRLQARRDTYRGRTRSGVPVRVRVGNGSAPAHVTAVEIRCADRIGLLAEVVAALYAEGLDVAVAIVDTRAGEALDTFMVTRGAAPIRDPSDQERLARSLKARLEISA